MDNLLKLAPFNTARPFPLAYLFYLLPLPLFLLYIYFHPSPPRPLTPSYTSPPKVLSVSLSPSHDFSKPPCNSITLIPNLGVKGDAHLGKTVQHRSRLHINPPPENLRQVHLIQNEILIQFSVDAGEIGENITTTGIDLLSLARGTKLRFVEAEGADGRGEQGTGKGKEVPTITITGLRNPCPQIEKHRKGLQEKFIVRDAERQITARKAGVMSTVHVGGDVRPGMTILLEEPEKFEALGCV